MKSFIATLLAAGALAIKLREPTSDETADAALALARAAEATSAAGLSSEDTAAAATALAADAGLTSEDTAAAALALARAAESSGAPMPDPNGPLSPSVITDDPNYVMPATGPAPAPPADSGALEPSGDPNDANLPMPDPNAPLAPSV